MKRKAIQLANNTLVISLPAKWVKANRIEKGADLEVDAKESILIIGKDRKAGDTASRAEINISGMSATLVWNYVNSVYRSGFTEIEIHFDEFRLKNIKTGKYEKTMDILSRITDKLIGVEIISQTKNSCTLKEITQMKSEEYSNVMNRLFLSLRTMSDDVLNATKVRDADTLENLYLYSEINVNKLSDYCLRMLNIEGLRDFRESNLNYLTTFLLEEVGDCYARIARIVAKDKKTKFNAQTFDLFHRTNELLSLTHKIFLRPRKDLYADFHAERFEIKQAIDSQMKMRNSSNLEVLLMLKVILDKLMEINNCVVTSYRGL